MRCVACNRILSIEELIVDRPGLKEPEDLCYVCRGSITVSEFDNYNPRFRQFEGIRPGLTKPCHSNDE